MIRLTSYRTQQETLFPIHMYFQADDIAMLLTLFSLAILFYFATTMIFLSLQKSAQNRPLVEGQ